MGGLTEIRDQTLLLVCGEAGGRDFLDLGRQHSTAEGRLTLPMEQLLAFALQPEPLAMRRLVGRPLRPGPGVAVQQPGLLLPGKEGLVIVRSVQINQKIPQQLEQTEGGWGAVDELAARAGGGKGSLEQELSLAAWLHPVLAQQGVDRCGFGQVEDRFDGADLRSGPDQRAVAPFAQQQLQGAEEHRLAGSGFTGDGVESGARLPGDLLHEGEVANLQGGERCGHQVIMR